MVESVRNSLCGEHKTFASQLCLYPLFFTARTLGNYTCTAVLEKDIRGDKGSLLYSQSHAGCMLPKYRTIVRCGFLPFPLASLTLPGPLRTNFKNSPPSLAIAIALHSDAIFPPRRLKIPRALTVPPAARACSPLPTAAGIDARIQAGKACCTRINHVACLIHDNLVSFDVSIELSLGQQDGIERTRRELYPAFDQNSGPGVSGHLAKN